MLTVINHFEIKSQRILFTNFSHLLEKKIDKCAFN